MLTDRGTISAPISDWARTSVLSGTPATDQVWTVTLRTAGGATESYSYKSVLNDGIDHVGSALATAITNGAGGNYQATYTAAKDTLTVVRKNDTTSFDMLTARGTFVDANAWSKGTAGAARPDRLPRGRPGG